MPATALDPRRHFLTRSDLTRFGIARERVVEWLAAGSIEQVGELAGEHGNDPVFAVHSVELREELEHLLADTGKTDVSLQPARARSQLVRVLLAERGVPPPAATDAATPPAAEPDPQPEPDAAVDAPLLVGDDVFSAHAAEESLDATIDSISGAIEDLVLTNDQARNDAMRDAVGLAPIVLADDLQVAADDLSADAVAPPATNPDGPDVGADAAGEPDAVLDAEDGPDTPTDPLPSGPLDDALVVDVVDTLGRSADEAEPEATPVDPWSVDPVADPPLAIAEGHVFEELFDAADADAGAEPAGTLFVPNDDAEVAAARLAPPPPGASDRGAGNGTSAHDAGTVAEVLQQIHLALLALAEKPAARMDLSPLGEAIEFGLAKVADSLAASAGLTEVNERLDRVGTALANGSAAIADAIARSRAAASTPAGTVTALPAAPVAPPRRNNAGVLLAVALMIGGWIGALWLHTGDPRTAMIALFAANLVGCASMLFRR
jgi:hypothetical protein